MSIWVGSYASSRQLLQGAQKVWQGLEQLHEAIDVQDAIKDKGLSQ
ncbi:MAG: hypothetical protein OXC62_03015 [Aestuariivita sp.]|nr:hypothetical protein [Aestuariivita sp.]